MLREYPRPFVYSVLAHVVLVLLLVFSLDWNTDIKPSVSRKPAPVQAVAVDAKKLDESVRRKEQLKQDELRKEQKRLEAIEQKKQAARRKLEAEKKRKADAAKKKVEAERKRKADVARKKKLEVERKKKSEVERKKKAEAAKKKADAERKRQAEQERKRKAEAERKHKAEAERKRKKEAARRKAAEKELQKGLAAEQERLNAQRQTAMQRIIDEYALYIRAKVQRNWIKPPDSGTGLACTVEVRLIPGGEVVDVRIVRSSGNAAFDRSVETAVFKASPLPVPSDPEVMDQFRSLRFEFRPE